MDLRFLEYYGEIYVVVGMGYDCSIDPPDVFYCLKLEDSIIRTVISYQNVVKLPISEVIEITDINRIKTLWILYGSKV